MRLSTKFEENRRGEAISPYIKCGMTHTFSAGPKSPLVHI